MRFWRRLFHSTRRADALKSIQWNAVTQIDAARVPTLAVENFWIILWSGDRKLIEVADCEKGYEAFKAALLEEWPQLEGSLNSVFMGSPDIEEHVTLWKQRESY